jgi:hypothetical protein
MHTRTQTLWRTARLVDGAGTGHPTSQVTCAHGFSTHQLACMIHSLVRVSRRADWRPSASIVRTRFLVDSKSALTPRSPGRQRRGNNPRVCPAQPTHADQLPAHPANPRAGVCLGAPATSNRFPLNDFKHLLTLFSKFFSSFVHTTCSLSVSRPYLALDGIYHPLWAAFPNNPTRRWRLVR